MPRTKYSQSWAPGQARKELDAWNRKAEAEALAKLKALPLAPERQPSRPEPEGWMA